MKFPIQIFFCVIVIFLTAGCASIISHSRWPLTISTNPSGANVEIKNKTGKIIYNGTTPATISLKSSAGYFSPESYGVRLSAPGLQERLISVKCGLNGYYFGNIMLGGLVGFLIIDPATGAMYKLDREYLFEDLSKPYTPVPINDLGFMVGDSVKIPNSFKIIPAKIVEVRKYSVVVEFEKHNKVKRQRVDNTFVEKIALKN